MLKCKPHCNLHWTLFPKYNIKHYNVLVLHYLQGIIQDNSTLDLWFTQNIIHLKWINKAPHLDKFKSIWYRVTDDLGNMIKLDPLASWVFLAQNHSLKNDSKNEISHLNEGKEMGYKTTFIRSFWITLIMEQPNRCECNKWWQIQLSIWILPEPLSQYSCLL